jgi:hypothetical protein
MPPLESVIARIRGKNLDMPALGLTFGQACRLWHIDALTCQRLLEQLVREALLYKTDNGVYIAQSGTPGRHAQAELRERVTIPRSA